MSQVGSQIPEEQPEDAGSQAGSVAASAAEKASLKASQKSAAKPIKPTPEQISAFSEAYQLQRDKYNSMPDDWKKSMRSADAQSMNTDFNAIFQEADVNQDQILDKQEYFSFMEKWEAKITEKFGSSLEFTEEEKETIYNAKNSFNPDVDGISLADFGTQKRCSMALQKGSKAKSVKQEEQAPAEGEEQPADGEEPPAEGDAEEAPEAEGE